MALTLWPSELLSRRVEGKADQAMVRSSILFIHGIQGHPRKTWAYSQDPSKPKSKVSKIFHSKKKSSDASGSGSYQGSLYWPKDLLSKDFEDVRILTYGYDSHISHFFQRAGKLE
jgi:hypothetical protein